MLKLKSIGLPLSAKWNIFDPLKHGSRITSNGIWALVITGKLLVITGNGDYWRFSAPKLLVIWDAHAEVGTRFHKNLNGVAILV
jgi:hypothetical protein